jgi:hypothetical protein
MAQIGITLAIILAAMVLFAWNRFPAALVAAGASRALYFTARHTGRHSALLEILMNAIKRVAQQELHASL